MVEKKKTDRISYTPEGHFCVRLKKERRALKKGIIILKVEPDIGHRTPGRPLWSKESKYGMIQPKNEGLSAE